MLSLADLGVKRSADGDCHVEDKDNYIDIVISGHEEAVRLDSLECVEEMAIDDAKKLVAAQKRRVVVASAIDQHEFLGLCRDLEEVATHSFRNERIIVASDDENRNSNVLDLCSVVESILEEQRNWHERKLTGSGIGEARERRTEDHC